MVKVGQEIVDIDEEEIAVDLVKGGYDPFATLILKPLRKRFLNFIDVIVK